MCERCNDIMEWTVMEKPGMPDVRIPVMRGGGPMPEHVAQEILDALEADLNRMEAEGQ
jgi:hypothetical protein